MKQDHAFPTVEARPFPRPFGIDFTPLSADEILDGLLQRPVATGEGTRLLLTCNVDHIVQLRRDPDFRDAYRSAWMITADGTPVYLYARRHRPDLQGRIAGSDLIEALLARFDAGSHRPFFICADIDVAEGLQKQLIARGFDRTMIGFATPPFGFERDCRYSLELAKRVHEHGTTHLAIGLGAPKSETWAHRFRHELGDCYVMPVGAGLEYAVGTKRRAPKVLRQVGFEWAWRVALEPRRLFQRYAIASWGFVAAIRQDRPGRSILFPTTRFPLQRNRAMPRFSVVIPFRDRLPLVRRALASLDRQSFRDFETILVDDGSQEDVTGIAASFPDLAIRLIRTGRHGANAARNAGTDAASAAWVAYLDSDDVFLPDRLASAAHRVAAEPSDLLATAAYVWRSSRRVQVRPSRPPAAGEDISDYYFAAGERLPTSGLIVRTTVARSVRWDERLRKVQDPDFVIRLVRAGHRVGFCSAPDVAIYDDTQAGRISDSVVQDNLRAWLANSGHNLTPRARAGFEVYALAYETGRESRLRGLGQWAVTAARGRAPWRLTAKSLYRLLAPVDLFKATAQLALLARRGTSNPDLADYLRLLEQGAPRPHRGPDPRGTASDFRLRGLQGSADRPRDRPVEIVALMEGWRLILASCLGCAILAAGYAFFRTPMFQSEIQILVENQSLELFRDEPLVVPTLIGPSQPRARSGSSSRKDWRAKCCRSSTSSPMRSSPALSPWRALRATPIQRVASARPWPSS